MNRSRRAEDHLTAGAQDAGDSFGDDAGHAGAVEVEACDPGVGVDVQVGPARGGFQIAVGCAPPAAAALVERGEREAAVVLVVQLRQLAQPAPRQASRKADVVTFGSRGGEIHSGPWVPCGESAFRVPAQRSARWK